ncbi:MAG: tRNA (guanosine(46)-N7)-methyltransferase TrmB [Saprospiraceae bacterium]|nr:tRNA (guanosine(46)-N7)-methyltransferase TrmB [Saprospiraceae bacterium]
MSRRNKLQKFADLQKLDNVYENFSVQHPQLVATGNTPVDLKGCWGARHFGNAHPLTLELGCGKGEYTVGLGRRYPDRNFIGVDIKGARIWKGATQSHREALSNVAFLRTRIECITAFFGPGEVDEIWITFPDPFPRDSKVNRRLTAPVFLKRYRMLLKKRGLVHLKTDDPGLYAFTLETIEADPACDLLYASDDVYAGDLAYDELAIQTFYERMHLADGRTIKYLRFTIH